MAEAANPFAKYATPSSGNPFAKYAAQPDAPTEEAGFVGSALGSGASQIGGLAAGARYLGVPGAQGVEDWGNQWAEKHYAPSMPILEGLKEHPWLTVKQQLGGLVGSVAAPMAAAAGTTALVAGAPEELAAGAVAAAVEKTLLQRAAPAIAEGVAFGAPMAGNALSAQQQAGIDEPLKAVAAGVAGGTIFPLIGAGKTALGLVEKDAAGNVLNQSLRRNILQSTAEQTAVMPALDLVGRYGAGKDLTSPEAMAAYKESALSGLVAGPFVGGVHGLMHPKAKEGPDVKTELAAPTQRDMFEGTEYAPQAGPSMSEQSEAPTDASAYRNYGQEELFPQSLGLQGAGNAQTFSNGLTPDKSPVPPAAEHPKVQEIQAAQNQATVAAQQAKEQAANLRLAVLDKYGYDHTDGANFSTFNGNEYHHDKNMTPEQVAVQLPDSPFSKALDSVAKRENAVGEDGKETKDDFQHELEKKVAKAYREAGKAPKVSEVEKTTHELIGGFPNGMPHEELVALVTRKRDAAAAKDAKSKSGTANAETASLYDALLKQLTPEGEKNGRTEDATANQTGEANTRAQDASYKAEIAPPAEDHSAEGRAAETPAEPAKPGGEQDTGTGVRTEPTRAEEAVTPSAKTSLTPAEKAAVALKISKMSPRDKSIVMALAGMDAEGHRVGDTVPTYEEVAAEHGLKSRQAVQQVLKRNNITADVITRLAAHHADTVDIHELIPTSGDAGAEGTGFSVRDTPNHSDIVAPYSEQKADKESLKAAATLPDGPEKAAIQKVLNKRSDTSDKQDNIITAEEQAILDRRQRAADAEWNASRREAANHPEAYNAIADWDGIKDEGAPAFHEMSLRDQVGWVLEYARIIDERAGDLKEIHRAQRDYEHNLEQIYGYQTNAEAARSLTKNGESPADKPGVPGADGKVQASAGREKTPTQVTVEKTRKPVLPEKALVDAEAALREQKLAHIQEESPTFLGEHEVEHKVWNEDTGRMETEKVPYKEAVKALKDDIGELRKFIECVRK